MRMIMRSLLLVWLFLVSHSVFAQAAAPQEWHGELVTPGGKLMLLVRLDAGGSGDMESINQAPGQKMALGAVQASASSLRFNVPAIGASYEAAWSEQEQAWVGQFRQGMLLPLTLRRGPPPPAAIVEGLDGDWRALLHRDGRDLRLVLHVVTGTQGTRVTLDSPDLGAFGLPVEQFIRSGNTVRFRVPSTGVQFSGQLGSGLDSMTGAWSRDGQPPAELRFQRDATQAGLRTRSQWPLAAATYRSEDVAIPNNAASGVVLAGTLSLPQGAGPFPAVILVSGSGAQDRDESMFGHKPFAVLADYLTRRGIAVLRYDDRGFGASTGNFETATSVDFASDANAAFAWLRTRPGIDARAIGLAGHSEGGLVAPIAAAANPDLAFLVLLAGPATDTDRLILAQRRAAGLAQGMR
ncbi:MAG TPA: peptidase S15, partial [Massilia sp.]|nr:peptidase S15 [Massilia sp.]